MIKRLLATILFVLVVNSTSKTVDINRITNTSSISKNQCLLLQQILSNITQDKAIRAYAGDFLDLGILMRNAGIPIKTINAHLKFLQSFLGESIDPILVRAAKALKEADDSANKLLFCIISGGCNPMVYPAMHVHLDKDVKLVPFESGMERTKSVQVRVSDKLNPDDISNIIFLQDNVNFALSIIHEGVHFADIKFLIQWIKANQKIIIFHGSPDQYFQEYVRFINEEVQVDEGFYTLFTESRAFYAEFRAMESKMQEPLKSKYLNSTQQRLIQRLIGLKGITQQVLRQFNVSAKNVLKIGKELGYEFEQTIKRASRLGG